MNRRKIKYKTRKNVVKNLSVLLIDNIINVNVNDKKLIFFFSEKEKLEQIVEQTRRDIIIRKPIEVLTLAK